MPFKYLFLDSFIFQKKIRLIRTLNNKKKNKHEPRCLISTLQANFIIQLAK